MTSKIHTLSNGPLSMQVIDLGAAIQSLTYTKEDGSVYDVILGYDDIAGYETGGSNHGAIVGRFGNRIGGASFELNGRTYELDANDGRNTLHGGFNGYHKRQFVMDQDFMENQEDPYICLRLVSEDGDQGFPGKLDLHVVYSLTKEGELVIDYYAVSDADTLLNVTNHSYFNLSGHAHGSVAEDHFIMLNSHAFLTVDEGLIPTGERTSVEGTIFDLRKEKALKDALIPTHPDLAAAKGYDNCFIVNAAEEGLSYVGYVRSAVSGLRMDVETDQPGVQLYIGNYLNETGKEGAVYTQHSGLCLETEGYPDAIHHADFPSVVLQADQAYHSRTVYRLSEVK